MGNDGLSLRRTAAFATLDRLPWFIRYPNEDNIIGYFAERFGLIVAPTKVAGQLFMETSARGRSPGSEIPSVFGFHGLEKFNPELEEAVLRRRGVPVDESGGN